MTLTRRGPQTLNVLLKHRLLRLYALGGAPVIRLLEGRNGISRRECLLLAIMAARGELSPSALAEQAHPDRPHATRGKGCCMCVAECPCGDIEMVPADL